MPDYTTPDFRHSALIIVDVQNNFALPGAPAEIPGTAEAIPNMQSLLHAYREKALPIIHVVRLYLADGSNAELCRKKAFEKGHSVVVPGTTGAEMVDALKPDPSVRLDTDILLSGEFQDVGNKECIMYKPRWGAFYGTALESRLKDWGANTLVVAGCNYPNCPRTTIYEASERDFRIALARDALSGLYDIGIREMENIGVHGMTTQEIISRL